MNKKATRLIAASVITLAGMYLLIVLLNSMRPVIGSSAFTVPGQFLYLSFLEAAFYLPLLFLISGFMLFADYYNARIFFAKLLSLLPFFTLSLLLRVLNYVPGSPAADYFIENIGLRGSSMLLGVLLIPELLLIVKMLTFSPDRKKSVKPAAAAEPAAVETAVVETADTGNEPAAEVEEVPEHSFEPVPLDWPERAVGGFPSAYDEDEPEEAEAEYEAEDAEPETEELNFEEDLLFHDDYDEPPVEPIDLDAELEDDIPDVPVPSVPVHVGEDNYPDAPVRGDEEEISRTAADVWAEAEQLGFDDVMPEQRRPVADEQSTEMPDITEEPSPAAVAEVLGDIQELEQIEDLEELEELEELDELDELDETELPEETELPDDVEELDEPDIVLDIDSVLSASKTEAAAVEEPSAAPVKRPAKKRKPKKYTVPVDELLEHYGDDTYWVVDDETKAAAEILRETLEEFKIAAEVTGISKGPVITMFEILPAPGVKLSKIVNLADNIALRLAASRVRIVAPIPGKHAVGIEVPNKDRAIVSFKEILEAENLKKSRMSIPVVLGKDITGGARIIDLVQTPHLLIAGATGSGKSVCVNSLICSVLYSRTPDEVKMILIDPKIVELKMYNDIPHLLTPVITEPKRAFQALQYAMCEMERRYSLLNALGVRDIKSYNRKVHDARLATEPLPYIVIIVDEFADLMATTGKELENVISRLAAMSRAVGIHLVLATQRPSVDVITGLIKANIPSRIAFMVASKTDSRIILDGMGAEKLLGKGDMLFTSAWDPNPVRIQGAFLSDDEVERVTDHVKTLGEPDYIDDEIFLAEDENEDFMLESAGSGDPLMDQAIQIVVEAGKASASYLQRRLKIGYNRAARLVEEMEDRGIVGPANGSKPREIIHIPDRV